MTNKREEYAIVLDFLAHGYPFDERPSYKKKPVVQSIGTNHLTLMELIPKKGVHLKSGEKVYIGSEKRENIHHIASRMDYEKLTETARTELKYILEDLVLEKEEEFIKFFNKASPLSTRMHQLELLPGLGKKHMKVIIKAREEKPFDDFEDLKERVSLIPDPVKTVVKRIIDELKGDEKYNIFIPAKKRNNRRGGRRRR
ncbi:MAG: DUF655 domain-containing protein [Candidatus Woesearchaeota archaeon]